MKNKNLPCILNSRPEEKPKHQQQSLAFYTGVCAQGPGGVTAFDTLG